MSRFDGGKREEGREVGGVRFMWGRGESETVPYSAKGNV